MIFESHNGDIVKCSSNNLDEHICEQQNLKNCILDYKYIILHYMDIVRIIEKSDFKVNTIYNKYLYHYF